MKRISVRDDFIFLCSCPSIDTAKGRGRNKFENLCPIPLKKDSIKYVHTKPNHTATVFIAVFPNFDLLTHFHRQLFL